jgi:hypothetical protein
LCFGQGIDLDQVRHVIHVEVANLKNYLQEIGRAGRDGQLAYAHLFFTHLPPLSFISSPEDHQGVIPMREFLEINRCRNISLHTVADGTSHSCAALGCVFCDFCDAVCERDPHGVDMQQPLNFDMPTLPGPTSITVESNAAEITAKHEAGLSELDQLRKMLEEIQRVGCLECFIWPPEVHPGPPPHNHPMHALYHQRLATVLSMQHTAIISWPFCYRCWVPYRAPLYHPSTQKGRPLEPEKCPYGDPLPRLLTHLILDQTLHPSILQHLGQDRSQPPNKTIKWLQEAPSSTTSIPNIHRYLIAYHQIRTQWQ